MEGEGIRMKKEIVSAVETILLVSRSGNHHVLFADLSEIFMY